MSLSRVKYLEKRIKRAEGRHAQHTHKLLGRILDLTPDRVSMMEPGATRMLRAEYAAACAQWFKRHVSPNQIICHPDGRLAWRFRSNGIQRGETWSADQYYRVVND